jgi:hypothetical protein
MTPGPGTLSSDVDVTTALAMVSQLRALFDRLPHVPTPKESAELEEFGRYRQTRRPLDDVRKESVRTGFREAWRSGDLAAILDVGARLPQAVFEQDLDIQMYHTMAQLRRNARPTPHHGR